MTTYPKNVYSVGHFRYQKETYVFASGEGPGLNVFKLSDLKQSGFTGKPWFYFSLCSRKETHMSLCANTKTL